MTALFVHPSFDFKVCHVPFMYQVTSSILDLALVHLDSNLVAVDRQPRRRARTSPPK